MPPQPVLTTQLQVQPRDAEKPLPYQSDRGDAVAARLAIQAERTLIILRYQPRDGQLPEIRWVESRALGAFPSRHQARHDPRLDRRRHSQARRDRDSV